MIEATNQSKPKEIIPSGNYLARCYSMIHIGTVPEIVLGVEKLQNKVRISWELPLELRVFSEEKGEQPLAISKEYTLSMHEKANLRKDLESWRGKGFSEKEAESFDITKLLGVPCMLNIIHKSSKNGNEYAIIQGITGVPKGFTCPAQINKTFEFNYNDNFDFELPGIPDFLKEKIRLSKEWKFKVTPENVDLIDNVYPEQVDDQQSNDLPF